MTDEDSISHERRRPSATNGARRFLDDLGRTIDRRLNRIAGRRRPVDRLRQAWRTRTYRDRVALRRLDRALRGPGPAPKVAGTPSIQQIARDLRRLGGLRRSPLVAQSRRWQAAVLRAYDARLALACRMLGLAEHLDELAGMDRDLERLRIEGSLRESGIRVR